jgi:hypothetical protein
MMYSTLNGGDADYNAAGSSAFGFVWSAPCADDTDSFPCPIYDADGDFWTGESSVASSYQITIGVESKTFGITEVASFSDCTNDVNFQTHVCQFIEKQGTNDLTDDIVQVMYVMDSVFWGLAASVPDLASYSGEEYQLDVRGINSKGGGIESAFADIQCPAI